MFHIEEHAYDKLRRYLDAIKGYFTTSEGRDEIIQDVEARTDGELRLSAGTLYRSIARMVDQGLITELTKRRIAADDARRRYYRLTPLGNACARAEMRRLSDLVRLARQRGLTPETV